jgi:hypothetical protein
LWNSAQKVLATRFFFSWKFSCRPKSPWPFVPSRPTRVISYLQSPESSSFFWHATAPHAALCRARVAKMMRCLAASPSPANSASPRLPFLRLKLQNHRVETYRRPIVSSPLHHLFGPIKGASTSPFSTALLCPTQLRSSLLLVSCPQKNSPPPLHHRRWPPSAATSTVGALSGP